MECMCIIPEHSLMPTCRCDERNAYGCGQWTMHSNSFLDRLFFSLIEDLKLMEYYNVYLYVSGFIDSV